MLILGSRCPSGHLLTTATLFDGKCRICLGQSGGYYANCAAGSTNNRLPPTPPPAATARAAQPPKHKPRPARRIPGWLPTLTILDQAIANQMKPATSTRRARVYRGLSLGGFCAKGHALTNKQLKAGGLCPLCKAQGC